MSFATVETVAVTTDASGDSTDYTGVVTGRILSIVFTDTDMAAGADFTITTEDTGQAVITLTNSGASGQWQPRQATHDATGGAESYDGTNPVNDYIWAVGERIKIVTAQGGNATSGSFAIIVG